MPKIQSLKSNVTREDAIRHFTEGLLSRAAGLLRGPVRSMAELYIPFRRYEVKVFSGGRTENQVFALDAVHGVLDLYQFPPQVIKSELLMLDTRNVLPVGIASKEAADRLTSKVRRL